MIRQASLADAVEFLSERGLQAPKSLDVDCVIIDELMLLAWLPVGDTCEVHICVKRRGLRHLNELINAGIVYLQRQGFTKMATAIEPQYVTAIKLVERLGFEFVGCYNEHNIYQRAL